MNLAELTQEQEQEGEEFLKKVCGIQSFSERVAELNHLLTELGCTSSLAIAEQIIESSESDRKIVFTGLVGALFIGPAEDYHERLQFVRKEQNCPETRWSEPAKKLNRVHDLIM